MNEEHVNESMINGNFKVMGMTCAACAISLESYLQPLKGVIRVSVNYPNQSVFIDFDDQLISIETISAKAKEIGYTILVGDSEKVNVEFDELEHQRLKNLKKKLTFSAILSLPVFIISMFFMGAIPYENWILLALSVPILAWCSS